MKNSMASPHKIKNINYYMIQQFHFRYIPGFEIGLGLRLEWKQTFSSPVATAEFSKFAGILSAALSQHHLLGFEIAQLEFHHLH